MIVKGLVPYAVLNPSRSWEIRRGHGSHPRLPAARDVRVTGVRLAPAVAVINGLAWWIRAWRLIGGSIVHRINHEAPINHAKPELHVLLARPA